MGFILNPYRHGALPIPATGLLSMLDGSVSGSFYSDIAKTTNSSEGGEVAVWEDQSGNGNDWTQPGTASLRPTAQLSSGRLFVDGTGLYENGPHLVGPNISAWTEGSFFARVQYVSTEGCIWGTTVINGSSTANHWKWDTGVSHYVMFGCSTRGLAFTWNDSPPLPVAATDLMTYEENVATDGTVSIYIDGQSVYSADLGTTGFRSAPYLGIGIRVDVPRYGFNGYFYKFCAYSRVVSSDERTTINAWLES